MKLFNTGLAAGCLLLCGLGASAASAHSPNGHAYTVNVFSSFGTQFQDCFVFDNDRNLFVEGYGSEIYRHDELNTQPEAWQATPGSATPGSAVPFILSFHGSVGGASGQTIIANGMNSSGDTFILQGIVDSSCLPTTPAKPTPSHANSKWKK